MEYQIRKCVKCGRMVVHHYKPEDKTYDCIICTEEKRMKKEKKDEVKRRICCHHR